MSKKIFNQNGIVNEVLQPSKFLKIVEGETVVERKLSPAEATIAALRILLPSSLLIELEGLKEGGNLTIVVGAQIWTLKVDGAVIDQVGKIMAEIKVLWELLGITEKTPEQKVKKEKKTSRKEVVVASKTVADKLRKLNK